MNNELNIKLQLNPTNLATKNADDFTITESGDAYVSQRTAAKLCGVYQNSIVHLFKGKGDISQGLNPEQLSSVVRHYAVKRSKPEAIASLSILAEAGAKAWMYHEAGYSMQAKPTQTFNVPTTMLEAMKLATEQMEIVESQKVQLKEKSDKILLDAPKVAVHDVLMEDSGSDELLPIADVAKMIGLGSRKIYSVLRDDGILLKQGNNNIPYQKYIDSGYFKVKYSYYFDRYHQRIKTPVTKVTSKGLLWLTKKYAVEA